MKLFALAATLCKDIPNGKSWSLIQGYRRRDNEDEARGSFMRSIEKEKPDFYIFQMLVMEIPPDETEEHNE
jgi:hypothetical protein